MTSNWKDISLDFNRKIVLLLSLFVFSGYNNFVDVIPAEAVKTELVLLGKSDVSDRVFQIENSFQVEAKYNSLFPFEIYHQEAELHNYFSKLILKTQSQSYLEYKSFVIIEQVLSHDIIDYPCENNQASGLG